VEPFDPGHQATAKPDPGNCGNQQMTLGMEQCFETENADVQIDAAASTSSTSRAACLTRARPGSTPSRV
jgi:hypothetical protein